MVIKKIITNKLFIILIIFIFSFFLRLWTLNQMGKTWDEQFYVDQGYKFIELIKKGDFNNQYWYKDPDPPAVAKYIYGLAAHVDVNKILNCREEICSYDLTGARLMSALFSSFTSALVVAIGIRYISTIVGVVSGFIFSTLPVFLGLSQLATIESILIFFFTSTIYSFLILIEKFSVKKVILTGILLGLSIGTKYTNLIIVPVILAIYLFKYLSCGKKIKIREPILYFLPIFLISLATLFLIWPTPWFHLSDLWQKEYSIRFSSIANHPPPEIFFGRLMPVPIIYYFVYFFITTPLIILILFFVGLKKIFVSKKWILYSIALWFAIPFLQSFVNMRQHGLRYIVEIYAPLSIIAAIGFDYLLSHFTKKTATKLLFGIPVIIYMFIVLYRITPYYLDYFNILVGGTKGVYETKSFQIGWWGQGLREAGLFLSSNAPPNAKIGLAISPMHVFPPLPRLKVSKFKFGESYDYVVVNSCNVLREGFDDSTIRKIYKPVYYVKADGAFLVTIYKK